MHVWLEELKVNRHQVYYVVWVDGEKYDSFRCDGTLTWSQQADVAAGYQEALWTSADSASDR